jgi:hypothetical protein
VDTIDDVLTAALNASTRDKGIKHPQA